MRPDLHTIDWLIIAAYGLFAVGLGLWFTKRASASVQSFFVGDRNLPWWLAGTSIVATTFAADTPLAVTGLVASGGISHNWVWWSWGIAHVVATFLFARMWRRSGVITDAEITELRYSGKPAAWLRGFKALYFAIFINCLTMAWVIAAMVKISRAFFDVPAPQVIAICVGASVLYTTLGGFRSVVITDIVQFGLGMTGAIALSLYVTSHFGGIGETGGTEGLIPQLEQTASQLGTEAEEVLDFVPSADHAGVPLIYFVVLLIAGWWRYAEGNGYTVQRLAACRDEGHAQGASLWFAVAHNALRPWPWILVALAALVLYPAMTPAGQLQSSDGKLTVSPASLDLVAGGELTVTSAEAIALGTEITLLDQTVPLERNAAGGWTARFEGFSETAKTELIINSEGEVTRVEGFTVQLGDREMGYPLLMGRFLPAGLLGLVIASLLAAFMSTIDTHTNWGASYLVRDIYQRFINPGAGERESVRVSRLCIVFMGGLAGLSALFITSIAEVWVFLVTLGAGLGSVTAARWFWWRVTAWAEFTAIGVTSVLAIVLQLFFTDTLFGADNPLFVFAIPRWGQILIIAAASLATWIPVALFGPREDEEHLRAFAERVRPSGPGWARLRSGTSDPLAPALLRLVAGLGVVYGTLFGLGHLILGSAAAGVGLVCVAAGLLVWIIRSGGNAPTT